MSRVTRCAAPDAFSLARACAIALKEFVQMRRDRLTFAMMVGVPIMQLVLFGYAINTDPKALPTAVVDSDQQRLHAQHRARAREHRLLPHRDRGRASEAERRPLLARGDVQFVVSVPAGLRAPRCCAASGPRVLVEADATDPAATGNALAALQQAGPHGARARPDRARSRRLRAGAGAVRVDVHRRYNPEGITQYNIVPGLMGVILHDDDGDDDRPRHDARARARHDGEPARDAGAPARGDDRQDRALHRRRATSRSAIILVAAKLLFDVPMVGSLALLLGAALMLFIAANLAIGFTFSTLARNQLQAMQMTFFFFLPSMLLSGFMFPFRGMPGWAQALGEVLPLTHFLRIVRGILLKGNGVRRDRGAPVADRGHSCWWWRSRPAALPAHARLNPRAADPTWTAHARPFATMLALVSPTPLIAAAPHRPRPPFDYRAGALQHGRAADPHRGTCSTSACSTCCSRSSARTSCRRSIARSRSPTSRCRWANGASMWTPKMEARVLQELALQPHERVLEIGTG